MYHTRSSKEAKEALQRKIREGKFENRTSPIASKNLNQFQWGDLRTLPRFSIRVMMLYCQCKSVWTDFWIRVDLVFIRISGARKRHRASWWIVQSNVPVLYNSSSRYHTVPYRYIVLQHTRRRRRHASCFEDDDGSTSNSRLLQDVLVLL